jgi:hypothetical protein
MMNEEGTKVPAPVSGQEQTTAAVYISLGTHTRSTYRIQGVVCDGETLKGENGHFSES